VRAGMDASHPALSTEETRANLYLLQPISLCIVPLILQPFDATDLLGGAGTATGRRPPGLRNRASCR
jgi:hypothetical protein